MFLLGSWELLIAAGSKRLIGVARCLRPAGCSSRAAAGAASAGISLDARSVRPLGIPRSCVDEWRAACNGAIIEEGLRNAKMAHPIQIILTRQLAGYLSVPLFLVDPKGDLLFYNEPAEALLGRQFDETGAMPAEEWSTVFTPVDDEGRPIPAAETPPDDHARQASPGLPALLHPRT